MAATIQPLALSGPSGTGKTTLVKKLMAEFDGYFAFSVPHTTRKPRPGEEHGKDYYYIDRDEMEKKIANNDLVEHIEFSGNLYGISKESVQDVQASGCIGILDAKNIKQTDINPKYILCIPMEILEQRLRGRGTETEEDIQKRLDEAKAEMDYGSEKMAYDHILVNIQLEKAYEQLKGILMKEIESIRKHREQSN